MESLVREIVVTGEYWFGGGASATRFCNKGFFCVWILLANSKK